MLTWVTRKRSIKHLVSRHSLNRTSAIQKLSCLVLVALLCVSATLAQAQNKAVSKQSAQTGEVRQSIPTNRVMLITDGSGSMWGRSQNRSKVYLARDAIKKVLPQFHNRLIMGLYAFGSRRKRSCQDVSQITRLAPLNSAEFIKDFNGVNPLGRTPVTLAIKQAAIALDYKNKKSTIIVLIDGFENCKQDPCALARKLKRDGKDLTIHVIGLAMKPGDQKSVQCITQATKGQFIATDSGDSLRRAMTNLLTRSASPAKEQVLAAAKNKPVAIAKPKGPPELLLTALMASKGPQLIGRT